MSPPSFFLFPLSLMCCFSLILAQQPYFGLGTADCSNNDYASALGYTCNGVNTSCQSYLIFRSQSPYSNISSISDLLGSDPSQLAQINSVTDTATFDTNKEVIVPVNCSCSGNYSQTNTSYVIKSGDTVFWIANNTFQGLSTCQAILNQNTSIDAADLSAGTSINVPLRCACPTQAQSDAGVKYLMSYLVTYGDDVSTVSERFGVDTAMTLEANELSGENPTINPFTTLLIPLQSPPSSSQTVVPPPPPPPPPPSPPASPPSGSSKKTWVYIILGVAAGVVLLLLFGCVIFLKFFRKTKKEIDQSTVSESFKSAEKPLKVEGHEFLESISSIAQSVKVYRFEELQSATDNFSPSCLIQRSVYLGRIKGDFAAIKKMDGNVSNEVALLSKINHFNVIRLSGICLHDGHCYLVQEYAVNGPLSDWIYHNNNDERFLVWTQRIQIAMDVATGLSYLHNHINPPYIHKDIKSENVLLDTEFRAKIANFESARSAEGKEGQFALTRHIVGTKGYMAPEYLENGLISTQLDVYAFGVLMLEMLTGKDAAGLCAGEGKLLSEVLVAVLRESDGKEKLQDLVDPSLSESYHPELAILLIGLINRCLAKAPADRPDMDEIVQSLSRILASSQAWDSSNNIAGYKYDSESF